MKVYAVKQISTGQYDIPLFYNTPEQAQFQVAKFLDTPEGNEVKSDDFELYYLGEYDKDTGTQTLTTGPLLITNLKNLKLPTKESK